MTPCDDTMRESVRWYNQRMSDATPASDRTSAPDSNQPGGDKVRARGSEDTLSTPTDRILIRRVQRGDIEAFNLLVQRYEHIVFNFAFRLTGNYDDASDVAQDAFVRAFSAMGSFRGDAAFSTWIFRITTNVFLDEKKRMRTRQHASLDEVVELEESSVGRQIEDTAPRPDELAIGNERASIIARAIAGLPDFQKTMIVLYHLEHKAYEEIAQIMDLPIGTVKSRLNRARLALRDKLYEYRELF